MPLITQGLLFSHIPKTAGTSLRKSIRKYSRRWKVYADYSEGNATTSGFINRPPTIAAR